MSYKGKTIGEIYAETKLGRVRFARHPAHTSPPAGLATRHRPHTSAGVATMAELMRRSRVERDFGGVEDE